ITWSTGPGTSSTWVTSACTKVKAGSLSSSSTTDGLPVTKLSTATTSQPSASSRRHNHPPRKPAPPVTTTRRGRCPERGPPVLVTPAVPLLAPLTVAPPAPTASSCTPIAYPAPVAANG